MSEGWRKGNWGVGLKIISSPQSKSGINTGLSIFYISPGMLVLIDIELVMIAWLSPLGKDGNCNFLS